MLQGIAFILLWSFLWFVFTFIAGLAMAAVPALVTMGGFIWLAYTALAGYMSYKTIY